MTINDSLNAIIKDPAVTVMARSTDPHVWAMDPPDISASQHRNSSLFRAAEHMGLLWWNPESELYEPLYQTT